MKKCLLFSAIGLLSLQLVFADSPFKVGDTASDFNLKNTSGDLISFSRMADAKGFIVVFYSNVCPVSQIYEQRIVDLHNEFESRGYPVVAINSNDQEITPGDSYEAMKKVASEKGYSFQYLRDESQEVARNYGATATPHVYILSRKDGNLRVEYTGAIDNNADDPVRADKKYVADAVNALLEGKEVPVKSTKAVGCSIKWRK